MFRVEGFRVWGSGFEELRMLGLSYCDSVTSDV